MASGQMNFNMRFTADTSQAQSSIQQLQTSLSQIAMAGSGTGISKGMSEAAGAAKELSYHLNQAYNATTGNFDLSRLDKSLKTSKTNVSELSSKLLQAGQSGQQAFVQLAQSIAAADRPMITLSSRMKDFATTMKNTAKWQISSSVLHGFMGAVQQAYGYAQDLNESLNNIRIVTGYNIDQMAAFAEKANKAAKALSTTTTAYTDAALIYYQQGLGDKEIKERTAVTIKMANVSGQAAETVSDQMTAIWNNFYDGSKSLEYYADVMTKLGAATASSSDEIAQGLEKFAAVSESVGLSYEYATAALATVTAETRQSADVVGTAFKTLFARIQGLKLGETLEDGTNLNQYSEALLAVGVNIKEANGELKDMDAILNEMAAVWETLNRDEQVALAQKVAGVRQYNQLMSLMNNWDVMEQNLDFVGISEGSLQEQQDIYEESWKAAFDRVRASMESIYSDLIDDEFFIDLADGFSSLINSLDAFIDGFGGVKMIAASVASILMATFAHKVPAALENLKANFNVVFKGAAMQAQELSNKMVETTNQVLNDKGINLSASDRQALESANQLNIAKNRLLEVEGKLTPLEKQRYQTELLILQAQQEEVQTSVQDNENKKKALNLAEQELQIAREAVKINETKNFNEEKAEAIAEKDRGGIEQSLRDDYLRRRDAYQTNMSSENLHALKESETALFSFASNSERARGIFDNFLNTLKNGYDTEMRLNQGNIELSSSTLAVGNAFTDYTTDLTNLQTSLNSGEASFKQVKNSMIDLESQLKLASGGIIDFSKEFAKIQTAGNNKQLSSAIDELIKKIISAQIPVKDLGKVLNKLGQNKYTKNAVQGYDELRQKIQQVQNKSKEYQHSLEQTKKKQQELNSFMANFNPTHVVTGIERVTQAAAGLGQTAMLIQSFRSLIEAWNNDDLTFGEKLTTSFMSISMIIPSAMGAIKSFNTVLSAGDKTLLGQIALRRASNALMKQEVSQMITNAATQQMANILKKEGQQIDEKTIQAGIKRMLASKGIEDANLREILSSKILNQAKKNNKIATEEETVASGQLTLAKILENAANQSLLVTLKQLLVLYGPYLAIAGLVAGAIESIVYVIKQLEENSLENQFNKASEAAKEAADNYDKAKQSLEEIKSTIEDLKTIEDPFKTLNKGTIEWNNALLEANNEITKLINKYPELINYVKESSSVSGLNVITEEGYEYLQKMAMNTASSAAAHSFMAQNNKLDVSNQKLISDYKHRTYTESERDVSWLEVASSSFGKNSNNTVNYTPGIVDNTMYEFDTEQGYKQVTKGNLSDSEIEKIVNQMITAGQDARTAAEEIGFSNEGLLSVIDTNSGELDQIAQQYAQNLMAIKENTAAIIENTNSSNEEYSNSEYKDFIKATNVDSRISKEKEELQKKTDAEIIADYETYLKGITGAEHKVENGKVKKYDEETGTYSDIGDYAADKALDILAKAAAYKFSDEEINQTEETGKQYTDEIGKLKVTDSEGKAVALTEDQIKDIALGIYQAEQDDTQFNIGNVLKDLGTYSISTSSMSTDMQNKFSSTVQEGSFTLEGYTPDQQNLINSAEGYDIAKEKVEEYKESLNELAFLQDKLNKLDKKDTKQEKQLNQEIKAQKELIKTQENEIKTLATVGKAAEKYGLNEKELLIQTKQLSKQYKLTNEQAAKVAVRNQRLNKGVEALSENWSDWKKTLKATDKTTTDYSGTVVELTSTIADLVGASEDLELSPEFFESAENMSLLEKASKGNITAINALGAAVAAESVKLLDFNYILAEAANQDIEGPKLSLKQFKTDKAAVLAGIEELKTGIQNGTIKVGDGISAMDSNWIDSLNRMALATGMSVDEMNSLLNQLGVEATVTTTSVKQQMTVPTYTEVVQKNPDGIDTDGDGDEDAWGYKRYTIPGEPKVVDGWVQVAQIETGDNAGKGPKVKELTYTGRGTPAPSSTGKGKSGGGGGSSPKKAQSTKKSDIVDRYKEQDDKLDDLKRTMDNTADSFDRLYGEDKLEAIDKLIQAEKDYKDVLKEKRSEAQDALKEDRKALDAAASKVSVEFEYDAEGNLINYTEQMEALYNRLRATEKAAGDEWTESEQEQIDALKEKIEELKEAKEQYEDTRELIEDLSDELKDLAGKPAMPLIKSDTIDIYKEIIDALDDIEARLERISKRANDRLGKERLTYFGKYLDASKDKLSQLNAELEKNTTDIKENKSYLNKVGKLLDFNQKIKYDDKGNITNYDELTDILWQRIFKAQEKAKKDGKITNAEQQGIDALIADAEMWRQAAEKYTNAVEYKEDLTLEKKELTDKVIMLPAVTNDFLDIYKEVDDVLDDIGHELNYIAEQSERLTGSEKIAALKEMVDLEKERLFYIQNEQLINVSDKMEKRSALETSVKKLGIGMTLAYDENGNVTNYNEIMSTYKQSYNTAYAKAMADGALTASEKEWLEQFKEDGQYVQEYFDQYNNALEKGEDLAEDALEAMQNIEDYSLDVIDYTVELNIEANERDLAFIDYQLSQLEDQAFSTAESIALLEQKYLNLSESSSDYENGINSIFQKYIDSKQLTQEDVDKFWQGDASGISWAIFTADEISNINKYSDGIMSVSESMLELRKTLDEAVITSFEEWTAEMQEQLSLFDHYESVINSYNNIIDLVGQKKLNISNDDRKDYNQLRVNNANNRLSSSKAYFDETTEKIANAEKEKAAAEARLAAAQSSGDENLIKAAEADVKMWGDTLKVMYQENRNAEQQYLADWEAALEASKDAFLAETEMELEAFEEKMAGVYGSFENMQKEFNRQTEKNDRYLQDYEKLYELSKLNRDLSNKIDDTTNLKAKKELAKLQEEILEAQKDGVKTSDYDLKFLQKKYNLKLAEIALEEAQNAKTQVRLTRDAEGNYSYTYTADEDSIAKAQQNYEDQLYGIANLSNEYIEQQTSKLLSTQQAFVNDLVEIHKKAAEGQYATTEEYQQALDKCSAYYTEQLAYYGSEIDKAASNNSTIYENDYSNYAGWTVEKIRKTEEDTDAYITGASNKSAAEAGFVTSVQDLLPDLKEAHEDATGYVSTMTTEIGNAEEGTGLLGASKKSYEKYSENIDTSMSAAGTSTETFKDKTSEYLLTGEDSVANSSDEARQKIEEMVLAITNLDKTIANVSAWQTSYSNELQKVIDKTADVITSVGNMNQAIANSATLELQKPAEKPSSEGDGKKEDKPASTIENPITDIPAEATCPICKKPLSQCNGHDEKKEEKKCPKCGKNPCKCKEIEEKKKAEEEAKRKAAEEKKKKQQAAKIAAEATEIIQLVNAGKLGNKKDGWIPAAKAKYSKEAVQIAKDAFNNSKAGAGYDYNYKKALALVKLDTGGYTGAWGPDGKLALLHEKELVLNKQDTENMLKIVSIVRDLSAALDSEAYYASLAQLRANQLYQVNPTGETFEQTVTIHAEFPHATNAIEIETALNNLVNSASQFANRK